MDTAVETAVETPVDIASEETGAVQVEVEGDEKLEALKKSDESTKILEEIAKKQRDLKAHERLIERRKREAEESANKYKKYEELEALKSQNPLAVMEKLGLTLDDLLSAATSEGAAPKDKTTLEFEKMRAEIEEQKQQLQSIKEERQRLEQEKQYAELVKTIRDDLSASEDFEALNTWGNYDAVAAVMQKHFQETGDVLDAREAAQIVQDYLVEQSAPFFKSKMLREKYKQYFAESDKGSLEDVVGEVDTGAQNAINKTRVPQGMRRGTASRKTLSEAMRSQGAASGGEERQRLMTREEALDRAAKMIRWN